MGVSVSNWLKQILNITKLCLKWNPEFENYVYLASSDANSQNIMSGQKAKKKHVFVCTCGFGYCFKKEIIREITSPSDNCLFLKFSGEISSGGSQLSCGFIFPRVCCCLLFHGFSSLCCTSLSLSPPSLCLWQYFLLEGELFSRFASQLSPCIIASNADIFLFKKSPLYSSDVSNPCC